MIYFMGKMQSTPMYLSQKGGRKMSEEVKEKDIILTTFNLGQSLMEYYIKKIIELKTPEIKKFVIRDNPHVDPEFVAASVVARLDTYSEEMAYKFNSAALLIIDTMLAGRIDEIRDFEVRFTDLLERTILRRYDLTKMINEIKDQIVDNYNK
jgi:hypothetical protein